MFADPPYNVAIDGNVCGLGRIRHREFAMGCSEMSEVESMTFLKTVFDRLAEHTIELQRVMDNPRFGTLRPRMVNLPGAYSLL
ncbi:MAG: hypothetical protein E6G77_26150 [Alphaproteobacteria bacterium]|nr:MAG: hypothetical protein E6G77_26150 [Alphaproteobacteria bacterium]